MRIFPILSALVFGASMMPGADRAEARIQQPCCRQYEARTSGSLYAPIPRCCTALPPIRD